MALRVKINLRKIEDIELGFYRCVMLVHERILRTALLRGAVGFVAIQWALHTRDLQRGAGSFHDWIAALRSR